MELSGKSTLSPEELDELLSPNIDYDSLTQDDLLSDELLGTLSGISDSVTRTQAIEKCRLRAQRLKCLKSFDRCLKIYQRETSRTAEPMSGNVTMFTDQPLTLNCGTWFADNGGVYRMKQSGEGSFTRDDASPIPVIPTAILTNTDSTIEKIELSYRQAGKWKSLVCERATAASCNKIIELANFGLEVTTDSSKNLVRYIADCVAMNQDIIPRYKSISRVGWAGGKFVPYDGSIRFDGERENRYLFAAISETGDVGKWTEHTARLRENPVMRLTMAASFAAPLIELCDALPFVFHLWGGTGVGKTVALMTAASVWGNPAQGKLLRTMNMTQNAMMDMAAFLRNLPFIGDELQTIKTSWDNYDKLIICVTEGVERGRMTYDRANDVRSWRNTFIFSGEEPVTKPNSGGGVKNRVIEIGCDTPLVSDGNETAGMVSENYGGAGRIYTDRLIAAGRSDIKRLYTSNLQAVLSAVKTTEKQAMAGAMLLTADALAEKYIYKNALAPLIPDDIAPYLTPIAEVDSSERAYDYIINFIAANANLFDERNPGETWGRIEANDTILINKNILISELTASGWDFEAVKGKWADKGYLIRNSQNCYYHQTKCNGIKAAYVKIRERKKTEEKEPDDMELPPFGA